MKEYMKPEVKLVKFVSESIADIIDGEMGIGSADVENPWGN